MHRNTGWDSIASMDSTSRNSVSAVGAGSVEKYAEKFEDHVSQHYYLNNAVLKKLH